VSGAPEAGFGDGPPHGPLAGLHVVLAPAWWPSPEDPIAGIFFLDYARAFAAAGAKVGVVYADLVFPPQWRGRPGLLIPRVSEERLDDIPVVRVRGFHTSLGRAERRTLRFGAWLRAGLKHYRKRHGTPDLIHAQCSTPAGWAALGAGVAPVVVTEHMGPFSLLLAPPALEALTRSAARDAAALVAVSPNLRRQMLEAGLERGGDGGSTAGPARDIPVIPNAVPPEFSYAPLPEAKRAPGGEPVYHAVFVGRLVREKGVGELALAATRLAGSRAAEIHWHIVGNGPEENTLREHLSQGDTRHRVTWHGTLARPRVADLLRDSHFLVLPSHGENCPLAVCEALSVGRPVVGTRETGIESLVGPEDGVLCKRGDAAALTEAVLDLVGRYAAFDPPAIAERARERFSYAAMVERYAPVFRGVLRPRE
jgi:glycosyltransferase involved in cell wall biosynthesis